MNTFMPATLAMKDRHVTSFLKVGARLIQKIQKILTNKQTIFF